MRRIVRIVIIIAIVAAVGVTLTGVGKISARTRIKELTDFGSGLVAQYSQDGELPDTKTRDEVLDRFVEHLKEDGRFDIGLGSYERTDSSVTVDIGFVKFVFAPRVKGIG